MAALAGIARPLARRSSEHEKGLRVLALHGVRLLLNGASAQLLGPWLDDTAASPASPAVEVCVEVAAGLLPPISELVVELQAVSVRRSPSGLVITDDDGSWFTVSGPPARIHGALAHPPTSPSDAQRMLLLSALSVALTTCGVYDLHAAAVCTNDRALILVGESGAGKSTTTTALASVGCRYLGDDGLMIRERAGGVELLAYSPSFRLTDHALSSFAELRPRVSKLGADPKWSFDASLAFPDRFLSSWLGPTSLLFLGRSGARSSTLASLVPAEALGLLIAQSSALGVDGHSTPREHLRLLALLQRQAHVVRLDLGSEWLEDPSAAARRLLDLAQSFPRPSSAP